MAQCNKGDLCVTDMGAPWAHEPHTLTHISSEKRDNMITGTSARDFLKDLEENKTRSAVAGVLKEKYIKFVISGYYAHFMFRGFYVHIL